jgi:Uma2 family endonuclease
MPDTLGISVVPDWVCEVLSPGTRRFDPTEKRASYAARGVAHLWQVDPKARTLEAQRLVDETWSTVATLCDGAEVSLPPFEAISFPLASLWTD